MKFEVAGMKLEIADMKLEKAGMKLEIADMKLEKAGMKLEINMLTFGLQRFSGSNDVIFPAVMMSLDSALVFQVILL